jgi:hypothetical protein
MNVAELIKKLNKVKNKNAPVVQTEGEHNIKMNGIIDSSDSSTPYVEIW